ncbi:MAG: gamma-glutamyl-gamma-aminobutyrate hydrolase family protein [Rhodospirillales bacterium]
MRAMPRPRIGLTLDAEKPGGYSAYPWYALRTNYAEAIAAAGGLPLALPHLPDHADGMLDAIDALVVTGARSMLPPALYGDAATHASVSLKQGRTEAELSLLRGAHRPWHAGAGHLRRRAVAGRGVGRNADQHIPDSVADALPQ